MSCNISCTFQEQPEELQHLEQLEPKEQLEELESLEPLEEVESLETLEEVESLDQLDEIEQLEELEDIVEVEPGPESPERPRGRRTGRFASFFQNVYYALSIFVVILLACLFMALLVEIARIMMWVNWAM